MPVSERMRRLSYPAIALAGVLLLGGGGNPAEAREAVPIDGFRDAVHHWQLKRGSDYSRHDPSDVGAIADNLLLLQRDHGGWAENRDPLRVLSEDEIAELVAEKSEPHGSFDNRNVYTQIEYLMGAYAQLGDPRYLAAAERGLDYLLSHQCEICGGWPHSAPAKSAYQGRITVADEVFSGPLTLLRGIAEARSPLDGFDEMTRQQAEASLRRGDDCLLRLQIRQGETLTGWAGQYDPQTLEPKGGRSFELPAIVSEETVSVLEYLTSIAAPSPEVIASVHGAGNWLRRVQIDGWKLETVRLDEPVEYNFHVTDFDRRLVEDPDAPPLWARFHDLADNSVVLANRDGVRVERYDQIHPERRTGYSWFGNSPASFLEKTYPAWQCRVEPDQAPEGMCD
ncbi:MAG: pectate lyase [Hyphomonas sp.]